MASSISGLLAAQTNELTQTQAGPQKPPANPPQGTSQSSTPEDTIQLSQAAQSAQNKQPLTVQDQLPTTAEILLLEKQGQSIQQIATHFGISVQQVLSYLGTNSQRATSGS